MAAGREEEGQGHLRSGLKAGKKEASYGVHAYVLCEMKSDAAIEVLNRGLKVCKDDDRLLQNRNLLQNGKAMKMKVYGEQYQFMLERPMLAKSSRLRAGFQTHWGG